MWRRLSLMILFGMMLTGLSAPVQAAPEENRSPFFAMDTVIQRGDRPLDARLDLLKELGYSGLSWSCDAPETVRDVAVAAEKRGLKLYAIYCSISVTPGGEVSPPEDLPALLDALEGHDTIIWFHVRGNGPSFASLSKDHPLIKQLRSIAVQAGERGLKIALYPHLNEWTERMRDGTRVAKLVDHPHFGVTFNLCHALASGDEDDIGALLKNAAPVLFAVTVNGADSGVQGGNWSRLIQPLGEGTFDLQPVMDRLQDIGFNGPIGLQGYNVPGKPRDILAPSMKAWNELNSP